MPRSRQSGADSAPDVPPVLRGGLSVQNAKVLIVDDEADVIEALKLRLETAGYDAMTASDGAEALEMLRTTQPDLILADLMMPHLDGLELTRRVRQNPSWFPIQVLLFSCHDDPVARSLALEFGALDYLSKTAGAHAIVSRIEEILAAGRPVPDTAPRGVPGQEAAERDLMAQLQAISHNSSAALSPVTGTRRSAGHPEAGAGTADDLRSLDKALAGKITAAGWPGPEPGP